MEEQHEDELIKVDTYCKSLSIKSFNELSEDVQKLFYIWAIYCNVNKIGLPYIYNKVLLDYKKLFLELGIVGRLRLCTQLNIYPAQVISAEIKGKLKTIWIDKILKEYNQNPSSVYFFDDSPETIQQTQQLGINSILVPYKGPNSCCLSENDLLSLVRKKKFDYNSVSMILLDFDKTIIKTSFKSRWMSWDHDYVVEKLLGGQLRLDSLLKILRILEHMGVKIGIITMNTEDKVQELLQRLKWC